MFRPHRDIGNEVLEVNELSKSYGDEKVFENISFKVNKGDKIALIGANVPPAISRKIRLILLPVM